MRGSDDQTNHMFSYLSPEQRVRADHPLRAIRAMTDRVFAELSPRFTKMYSDIGRPSIPPEQLLRALLLQSLYTVRSERLLMEEIDYSVLYRWFVGLSMDDPIWSPTTFSKNRDRLLAGDVAGAFFDAVLLNPERCVVVHAIQCLHDLPPRRRHPRRRRAAVDEGANRSRNVRRFDAEHGGHVLGNVFRGMRLLTATARNDDQRGGGGFTKH